MTAIVFKHFSDDYIIFIYSCSTTSSTLDIKRFVCVCAHAEHIATVSLCALRVCGTYNSMCCVSEGRHTISKQVNRPYKWNNSYNSISSNEKFFSFSERYDCCIAEARQHFNSPDEHSTCIVMAAAAVVVSSHFLFSQILSTFFVLIESFLIK